MQLQILLFHTATKGIAKSIVNGMVSAGRTASSAADSAKARCSLNIHSSTKQSAVPKELLRLETATQRTVKVDVTVDLIKEYPG